MPHNALMERACLLAHHFARLGAYRSVSPSELRQLFSLLTADRAGPAECKTEVLSVPPIINETNTRKTLRDANDDGAKASTNDAAAGGKTAAHGIGERTIPQDHQNFRQTSSGS
jgi:hypothetical protein